MSSHYFFTLSIILAVVFFTMIMVACQKQDELVINQESELSQTSPDYSNYKSEFRFYLDNKEVDENSLNLKSNDLIMFEKVQLLIQHKLV